MLLCLLLGGSLLSILAIPGINYLLSKLACETSARYMGYFPSTSGANFTETESAIRKEGFSRLVLDSSASATTTANPAESGIIPTATTAIPIAQEAVIADVPAGLHTETVQAQGTRTWSEIVKGNRAAGQGMELQYVEPGQAVQISLEEWDEGGRLGEHALAGIVVNMKPSYPEIVRWAEVALGAYKPKVSQLKSGIFFFDFKCHADKMAVLGGKSSSVSARSRAVEPLVMDPNPLVWHIFFSK